MGFEDLNNEDKLGLAKMCYFLIKCDNEFVRKSMISMCKGFLLITEMCRIAEKIAEKKVDKQE